MMPLTVMLIVTEETDANRLPAPVVDAAARWGADAASGRHVRSSANHIFRLERDGQPVYLRLSPTSEREHVRLAAELDFVEAVQAGGVSVARPLPSRAGNLIETVAGEDDYYAVLFAGLLGQAWLEPAELTAAMYRAWGQTLGRIHRVSREYCPPGPRRPTWEEGVEDAHRWLDDEPVVQKELDRAVAWLDQLPRTEGSYGLIHGDLELDNLVWDGSSFHVLDFDDAHYHWYAYDVALALEEVLAEEEGATRAEWFLEGYQSVPGTAAIDAGLIPRFLRLNRALTAARLVRAYAGLPEQGVPEWVHNLRAHHRRVLAATREAMAAPFAW